MISSITTNFTRVENYIIQCKQKIAAYRKEMLNNYVEAYADFWNLTLSGGTPVQPSQGAQPRTAQSQTTAPANADLAPQDKIFLMGTLAADYLQFAASARAACLALTPTATIPTTPNVYQFLVNADNSAYLQSMSVTAGVVTWTNVPLSDNGMAAATAAGMTVPSNMQPVT